MARPALVLDASVGVKWFSVKGEDSLEQAIAIRTLYLTGDIDIIVPDLFFYEVANVLAHKRSIPTEVVQSALDDLTSLDLRVASVGGDVLGTTVKLAREFAMTVYDACYVAAAVRHSCPLVTANPRHQGRALGCEVIPIAKWQARVV